MLGNPEKIKIYLEIEGIMDVLGHRPSTLSSIFEEMVSALVASLGQNDFGRYVRGVGCEDVNYFGVMLVYWLGWWNGVRSDSLNSFNSSPTALQIIKTRPNDSYTSGAFLMVRGTERYLFGDCAININPDAEALAEIAILSIIS